MAKNSPSPIAANPDSTDANPAATRTNPKGGAQLGNTNALKHGYYTAAAKAARWEAGLKLLQALEPTAAQPKINPWKPRSD